MSLIDFWPLMLLLSLLLGSFCTVLVYRIPREIPLGLFSHQRSRCPHCGAVVAFYDNIPLLSYLLLKGRARCCGNPIGLRYPLVELSTVVILMTTFFVFVNGTQLSADHWSYYAELVKVLYFSLVLVAVLFIDFEFRIIPDRFSLGSWVIALLAALFWSEPPILSAVIGGLLGFLLFFLLAWGYERLKGIEGLGFGDVKMMGWLGSWLGVMAVAPLILIASLSGIMAGLFVMLRSRQGMQTAIPFGPFLAFAAYLLWLLSLSSWSEIVF